MISIYFSLSLTLIAYLMANFIASKINSPLANPLLITVSLIIGFILLFDLDYDFYFDGTEIFGILLTLATVSLAVPLYKNIDLLKKNTLPILAGVLTAVLVSLSSILILAKLFNIDSELILSIMPKSITTGMAIPLMEKSGGIIPITAFAIILTAIGTAIFGPSLMKLFKIEDPIVYGTTMGSVGHVTATAVAYEKGELEGAIASLCIALTGLLTILVFPIALKFI